MPESPPAPEPTVPQEDWPHIELWHAVKNAVFSLPSRFESDLVVSGVLATDLFAFNASLGATIEEQVVASLNKLRSLWDPDQHYALYSFERQPQTFPDVVLRTAVPDLEPKILMGIELKGWYVLAKEREPSFRYKVSANVCAPPDLLVVVPWALSNVISGSPRVFTPSVLGAAHAAAYRNWYWEYVKGSAGDNSINLSAVSSNYPRKSEMIADKPASDQGGNFGRIARTGIMDDYMVELFDERLAGIPLFAWQRFLSLFTESHTRADVERGLDAVAGLLSGAPHLSAAAAKNAAEKFREIADLLAEA